MSTPEQPRPPSKGQFLVYPSEDGRVKIEVRLENETVWLTQQHLADLFQTSKQNVGQHLKNVFEERELAEDSVVKNFFTTAADGKEYRAETEYQRFRRKQIQQADQAGDDFDKAIKQLPPTPKRKKGGKK